jgi:hypothetical protein
MQQMCSSTSRISSVTLKLKQYLCVDVYVKKKNKVLGFGFFFIKRNDEGSFSENRKVNFAYVISFR